MSLPEHARSVTANINSKVALVTGGMGGLGEAICRCLAAQGIQAVVALHSPARKDVADWLARRQTEGLNFDAQSVDVSSYDSCVAAVDAIRLRHGRITILINNAGITRDRSFRKMSLDDWQTVLHTNLDSMFNMSKQVVEDMVAAGWGRIVNIASVNGQSGAIGQANYAASKSGIHGFTKTLALELAAKGITVNTVSPGYMRTRMVEAVPPEVLQKQILPKVPLGRLGEPDETAAAVGFLCSEQAGFVTGTNLSVNGGLRMD